MIVVMPLIKEECNRWRNEECIQIRIVPRSLVGIGITDRPRGDSVKKKNKKNSQSRRAFKEALRRVGIVFRTIFMVKCAESVHVYCPEPLLHRGFRFAAGAGSVIKPIAGNAVQGFTDDTGSFLWLTGEKELCGLQSLFFP